MALRDYNVKNFQEVNHYKVVVQSWTRVLTPRRLASSLMERMDHDLFESIRCNTKENIEFPNQVHKHIKGPGKVEKQTSMPWIASMESYGLESPA